MSSRKEIRDGLLARKISAIVRTDDQYVAEQAMTAAVEGGFRVIEFTLNTPGALELITQFRSMDESLLVGAGTVMTPQAAKEAVNAGAQFIVSPVCDPAVIREAGEMGVVSIPGTQTPTEMQRAHETGADFVKLFPAPPNVAEYIRYVLGPQPHLKIFPTSGVNLDNMVEVLEAGAAGVGFVGPLFNPQSMLNRNFDDIREQAEKIVALFADL
ncbi:MAG: bifunctional 4-hydroxy-2-oxoglutarate aldolase/2-dehydro-3-deoxy-phosphogluconate aldolase [Candidatus Marinimicrobia bacterium]|jgi:Entner-Doudoroff aldolase|nr:bifunctional 4-hydroxy-2-oxoglutarate aldolase/2-dehydro-3-deoxy-phosphogluconate aldolase [Candidatus Neomarinimicrobiota bacterium]|tara:strand:- start:13838 stop:14476 length:639 start_codon:yes stop_codon:yes gene_type:complete